MPCPLTRHTNSQRKGSGGQRKTRMAKGAGARAAQHLVLQIAVLLQRNEQSSRTCSHSPRAGPSLSPVDRTCYSKGRRRDL